MQQAHDAVGRVLTGGRGHTGAERTHVDLDWLGNDVGHLLARDNGARVRAGLAVGIRGMLPDQRGRADHALDIEEAERLVGLGADAFIHRVAAIMGHTVHAEEPAVLAVDDTELAVVALDGGIAGRHIVADRFDSAGLAKVEDGFFACDRMGREQDAVILHAGNVLKHFALAAAGSALVHDYDVVIVLCGDAGRRRVGGHPAFLLADVEQHGINALLRGRAGVEVVGKDLMAVVEAVMDADLTAVEVGVAEGGGDVDDRAGLVALGLFGGDEALQLCECERKECGVARADEYGLIAVDVAAGVEGHDNKLLGLEPFHGFLTDVGEVVAVNVFEFGLIGGLVVGDAHAVGVAAAHVILCVVDADAIFGANYGCFGDLAFAGDVVYDVIFARAPGAEDHFVEFGLCGGDEDAFAFFDHVLQFGRPGEFAQQSVHL